MKPIHGAIAISLALNLGLAVVLLEKETAAAPAGRPQRYQATIARARTARAEPSPARPLLAEGELAKIRDSYLAAGVDPMLVKMVVRAILDEALLRERASLTPRGSSSAYWKADWTNTTLAIPLEVSERLRGLARSHEQLISSLFPAVPDLPSIRRQADRIQFGDLPAGSVDAVKGIVDDYTDLARAARKQAFPALLPEDRQILDLLDREKEVDIRSALTAEELFEYEARTSPAAQRLRETVEFFPVSETDFRAILQLQLAFDAKFSIPDGTDQMRADRSRALAQLDTDIAGLLGAGRAGDYKRASDLNYRSAMRTVGKLGLPAEVADRLVAVQKEIQSRQTGLRGDRLSSREFKTQRLAELQTYALSKVTDLLGEAGLVELRRNGGRWIDSISMAPP